MNELDNQFMSFNARMVDLNEQEQLFAMPMTNFKIKETYKKFEVYRNYWASVLNWKTNKEKWLLCNWSEFNGNEVETEVNKYMEVLTKSKEIFEGKPETKKLSD